jgi:hypothetical protein
MKSNSLFLSTALGPLQASLRLLKSGVLGRDPRRLRNSPGRLGTWHRDTNRILEAAFGDTRRPPEVTAKLNALRDAVDGERHEEARRRRMLAGRR